MTLTLDATADGVGFALLLFGLVVVWDSLKGKRFPDNDAKLLIGGAVLVVFGWGMVVGAAFA